MRMTESHRVKITVIGAKNVGKTTLSDKFRSHRKFKEPDHLNGKELTMRSHQNRCARSQTLGADIFEKKMTIGDLFSFTRSPDVASSFKNETGWKGTDVIQIDLWDTAGYEKYGTTPPSNVLNGCDVVLICFSCEDVKTIEEAHELSKHVADAAKLSDSCACFLMGTKADTIPGTRMCDLIEISKFPSPASRSSAIAPSHEKKGKDIISAMFSQGGKDRASLAEKVLESCSILEKITNATIATGTASGTSPFITSTLCETLSFSNPSFCIMHAISVHLEKKGKLLSKKTTVENSATDSIVRMRLSKNGHETTADVRRHLTENDTTDANRGNACCQ